MKSQDCSRLRLPDVPEGLHGLVLVAGMTVMLLITNGCQSSQQTARPVAGRVTAADTSVMIGKGEDDSYVIRRGDRIKIAIHGYPELDTSSTVGESGMVPMKLIGDQQAAGLTKSGLSQELRAQLSQYIKTRFDVTVLIESAMSKNVTVLGEVAHQGNYPLSSDFSLFQVIALAGGSTPDSDLRHVKLFPAGDANNPIETDVSKAIATGTIKELPVVKPGDVVYVPRVENIIRQLSEYFRDAIFLFSFFSVFR